MKRYKKAFRKIHLWLGLTSGLVVFIIAITGCLYAFQEELQFATQSYRYVAPQNQAYLLPSQLGAIAQKQLPDKLLHSVKYNETDCSVEAIFYHYEPSYYYTVYLNPYTGKVLHVQNMEEGFFRWVLDGHFYLWLPHEVGQVVVAIFTLIFLVMVITGLILWWPANKKVIGQRLRFKWKITTTWKRKNFDLHSITGFYISLIALVFIITGLVWGFQWWAYGYYKVMGGEKSLVYSDAVSVKNSAVPAQYPLDAIYQKVKNETPNAVSIEVHPPETETSGIAVNVNMDKGTYWTIDYRYFDRYSLKEITVNHIYGRYKNATMADKLMRMNYDIHTGAVLGFAGKVLAFLVSLLIATLPITGCILWWNRRKKEFLKTNTPL
ncbi:MAG: PepSY-associated TM helix domain-containing protein [Bacteroidota bacterium]